MVSHNSTQAKRDGKRKVEPGIGERQRKTFDFYIILLFPIFQINSLSCHGEEKELSHFNVYEHFALLCKEKEKSKHIQLTYLHVRILIIPLDRRNTRRQQLVTICIPIGWYV